MCVLCFSFLPSKWKRLPRSVRRTQMLKKLKSRRFAYAETLPCVSSSCVVLVAIVCVCVSASDVHAVDNTSVCVCYCANRACSAK